MAIALPQASLAQTDPLIGTWHQNKAKSTYSNGTGPQNQNIPTVTFQPEGEGLKLVNETTKAVTMIIYDGQPHPVTGNPVHDAIAIKRIDPYTQQWTYLKTGSPVGTATLVISRDGRVATFTVSDINRDGRQINSVTVWEKQ
jgi:hypothetical protein